MAGDTFMARSSSGSGVSDTDDEWVSIDLSFDESAVEQSAAVDPLLAEALELLAVVERAEQSRAVDDTAFRRGLEATLDSGRGGALAAAERAGRAHLESVPALLERAEFDLACRMLERTVCVPAVRFEAASLLAQVACHCGDPLNALSILLWSSEFPPPVDRAVAHDFAYQLGAVFEILSMRKEALDIFRELAGEAGTEYRDLNDRIERLKG